MFFEFLNFKYFSFFWKYAETVKYHYFPFPLEIVKHNHLKSFSYNHGLFIFYFLQK